MHTIPWGYRSYQIKRRFSFSAGSDILDVSYASEVAKITGFTREDLKKYYIDYINLAVSLDKGIREEQVTAEQREELWIGLQKNITVTALMRPTG